MAVAEAASISSIDTPAYVPGVPLRTTEKGSAHIAATAGVTLLRAVKNGCHSYT